MNRVYLMLADGFEVLEALAVRDVMNRGGIECLCVAVGDSLEVTSSHALATVKADMLLIDSDLSDGAAIVLPGGYPGYVNLGNSELVGRWAADYYRAGRIVAAICGGPSVLARNGIARGCNITCHRSVRDIMLNDYNYVGGNVVSDGNLITGAGAGVCIEFALTIAARLSDEQTVARIKASMEIE